MKTRVLQQYRQLYVTNRLMAKCLLYRNRLEKFDLVKSGVRLEWAVPSFIAISNSDTHSESSTSFSMLEDSVEVLRRPYDSHVNLVAGRSNHQVELDAQQTQSRVE